MMFCLLTAKVCVLQWEQEDGFPTSRSRNMGEEMLYDTQACTITCRLRKSLRAIHLLTEKPIGYLLTNSPLTITKTLSRPICPLLSLSLTPLLWGGDLSLRYYNI